MAEYYIAKDNQRTGPFPVEQLVANGLTADSLVWTTGMAGWTRAADVPELQSLFQGATPPPPAPAYQQPAYQQPAYAASQPAGNRVDPNKVDMYLMSNNGKFPPEQTAVLRERLLQLDDQKFMNLQMMSLKDPTTALILSILLGGWGVDRFYLGDIGMGVGKLLTGGGCGIWWLVDIFLIMDAARKKNFEAITPFL